MLGYRNPSSYNTLTTPLEEAHIWWVFILGNGVIGNIIVSETIVLGSYPSSPANFEERLQGYRGANPPSSLIMIWHLQR